PTFSHVWGASGSSRSVMSLKSSSERMVYLADIARSHRDQHVAGPQLIVQSCRGVVKAGRESRAAPCPLDPLGQLTRDRLRFVIDRFAGREDRNDQRFVGPRQTAGEF